MWKLIQVAGSIDGKLAPTQTCMLLPGSSVVLCVGLTFYLRNEMKLYIPIICEMRDKCTVKGVNVSSLSSIPLSWISSLFCTSLLYWILWNVSRNKHSTKKKFCSWYFEWLSDKKGVKFLCFPWVSVWCLKRKFKEIRLSLSWFDLIISIPFHASLCNEFRDLHLVTFWLSVY